mgnify:CR=1 FL=1
MFLQAQIAKHLCKGGALHFTLALAISSIASSLLASEQNDVRTDLFSAPTILSALHSQYSSITNLSCTVRREVSGDQGDKLETMSHIDWARGDKMRVQVLKDRGRRAVIDGTSVYVKYPGDDAPAQYKIEDQLPSQFANLRSVPGSPEETLAPYADMDAAEFADAGEYARAVIFTPKDKSPENSAILYIDANGLVARIDIKSPANGDIPPSSTRVTFNAPFEVLPGVFLFKRITTEAEVGGKVLLSTTRLS